MSNKLLIICSLLFSLILLEVGVFTIEKLGIVNFEEPSYSIKQVVPFWRDISPDFGVWHTSNVNYHHKKSCFDVVYQSNSFGARDSQRQLKSEKSRAVVLGDSFVEGIGVAQEQRFTDLLEKMTHVEHLNFGSAGTFGPTQYWLLYKNLAKNFDHDMLIVAILPDNDFLDDDYDFGKKVHSEKYRPYWVGELAALKLVHYPDTITTSYLQLAGKYVKGFLREFSYAYRGIEYLFEVISYKQTASNDYKAENKKNTNTYSGYYDFTERQWQIMAHNLSLLAGEAKDKHLMFVTIPRHGDFIRHQQEGGEPPLPRRMEELAAKLKVSYLDLMPEMEKDSDWQSYFLSCDKHWAAKGHESAASIIRSSQPYQVWLSDGNIGELKNK